MAKKRTTRKPSAPPTIPMIEQMRNSGMMKLGDMMQHPPVTIVSTMQKPTAPRKAGGRKGRGK